MPKVDEANALHSNGVLQNRRGQGAEFPILGVQCGAGGMIVLKVPGMAHDLGCSFLQVMNIIQKPGRAVSGIIRIQYEVVGTQGPPDRLVGPRKKPHGDVPLLDE